MQDRCPQLAEQTMHPCSLLLKPQDYQLTMQSTAPKLMQRLGTISHTKYSRHRRKKKKNPLTRIPTWVSPAHSSTSATPSSPIAPPPATQHAVGQVTRLSAFFFHHLWRPITHRGWFLPFTNTHANTHTHTITPQSRGSEHNVHNTCNMHSAHTALFCTLGTIKSADILILCSSQTFFANWYFPFTPHQTNSTRTNSERKWIKYNQL